MNTKTWIIFGALVVAVLGGLILFSKKDQVEVANVDSNQIQPASEASGNIADQVFGNKESKVVLFEYGDFQCPGCASAAPVIKTLSEKYKDQLAFVFRNNPLSSMHPNAKAAASSAEAAGLQGKYWEMHDKIFAMQNSWGTLSADKRTDAFVNYAMEVGVKDIEKLKSDMGSKAVASKISFGLGLGKKAGVTGTPTFMLNGKKLDQYVKDGAIVASNTDGAKPIWSDQDAFEKLILLPAFKEAGVEIPAQQ